MKKTAACPVFSLICLSMVPLAVRAQISDSALVAPIQAQPLAPVNDLPQPLQFRAMVGAQYDANVLRAPEGSEQSDEIGVLGLGVKVDKRYGLQRVTLDAEVTSYRHRDLTSLDYSTFNYAAKWDWQLTPRLRGVVSADRRQFRDVTDTGDRITRVQRRTDRTELVDAIYEIDGAWRALAGLSNRSSSAESRSFASSPSVQSARVGAGYEFSSKASVFARVRSGQGEYRGTSSGDFREIEPDVVVKLPATAKTTFEGRLGYLNRKHSDAPARDFSGPVIDAFVTWQATEKTRLIAGAGRDLGSYVLVSGGHVQTDRAYVTPIWQASPKTSLRLGIERALTSWRDLSPSAPDAGRRDVLEAVSAGVDYEPVRAVQLSALVRAERRRSNLAGSNFRTAGVGLAARFFF